MQIDILKNRKNIEDMIKAAQACSVLDLYRGNVDTNAEQWQIAAMGENCALRIIACAIWRRNYTGITTQFRHRTAALRDAIIGVCRIGRTTLWRTLRTAGLLCVDTESVKRRKQQKAKEVENG